MKQPPLRFMWTEDPHALREIGSIASDSIPVWKQRPDQRLRVAKMGGKVVAYVQFSRGPTGSHHIGNVFVGWGHQRKGIGTALMRDAVRNFFKDTPRADKVSGTVIDDYFDEAAARHIYEKIGGKPIGPNEYVFRREDFSAPGRHTASKRASRPRKA